LLKATKAAVAVAAPFANFEMPPEESLAPLPTFLVDSSASLPS
jgi:hypothetical protein